jgi:hypothetical protein
MALPHYNQSKASKNMYEPMHQNLFEVTFLPPSGVSGSELLLEHVNTVGGLDGLNPAIDPVAQKYKFSDRSYAGMPGQTFVDIAFNFSLNINDANQAYIYKTLQSWYKKMYDPATGEMGLKKDYTGTIIIVEYNRKGDIYRKITLLQCFPATPPTGLDGRDYNSADPLVADMTFRCDHWDEELS